MLTLFVVGAVALAGCRSREFEVDVERTSDSATGSRALTARDLAHATYSGIFEQPVRLEAGRWEGEPFVEGAASRPTLRLHQQAPVFLDLDGDGVEEAAVLLVESAGGSASWIHLAAVAWREGEARSLAAEALGDRVEVRSLGAAGGRIEASLLEHSPEDPLCCPTREVRREWALEWGRLVQGHHFQGHLGWGHEVRSFTPCGSGEELWVVDETGELGTIHGELGVGPYAPVFVEIRGYRRPSPEGGFGEGLAGAVQVVELSRAEGEGPGCERELADFDFQALGNEPFWSVRLGEEAVFSSPDQGSSRLGPPDVLVEEGAVIFSVEESNPPLRVELRAGPCVDTMAGSRYGWRATARLGEAQLEGCAVQGSRSRS